MHSANGTQYDPESLYQQFLSYMKGEQKKPLQCRAEQDYKKLFSQLRKSNDQKKQKLVLAQTKQRNMKESGCKFTRIQGYRQLDTLKDSFIKCESRVAAEVDKQNIQDNILMEQSQQKQLQQEIDNYKISINRMTKQISKLKNQIKIVDLQQNKFQQAQHLATNIVQFTEQFSIVNMRNYNKMIQQQDQTLVKLKKMRVQAKNQLAETQFQFQAQQKQHDVKYKKMIKSCIPLQNQDNSEKKNNKFPKNLKRFIEAIQKVLVLLQQKQQNYELVKSKQCTKVASRKFDHELLPVDRVQWVKLVQQFQSKFEIRVESTDKILVELFKQIKSSNQDVEKKIFELKCLYEQYEEEYKCLLRKGNNIGEEECLMVEAGDEKSKQTHKKIEKVHQSSSMFVQIMELINSLLIKFRYIFKIFIMMNIDKKKLSDHLLKLDQVLDSKSVYAGCRLSVGSYNHGYNSNNQDTNALQMCQIFSNVFKNISPQQIQQIIFLFFNDFRAALIWRRTMIIQQLQQCTQDKGLQQFIKVLQTIRQQCQYSYNEKLKNSFKILFECLKSSSKSNQSAHSYRSHPRYSNRMKSSFLTSQLYFPPGMFPKTNINVMEKQEEEYDVPQIGKRVIQFALAEKQKQKLMQPQKWGEDQKKNPYGMIRKLAAITNQSTKKFKLLQDLHEPQKKYIKQNFKINQNILNGCINLVTTSSECKSQQTNNQQVSNKLVPQSKSRGKIPQPPSMNKNSSACSHVNNFVQ